MPKFDVTDVQTYGGYVLHSGTIVEGLMDIKVVLQTFPSHHKCWDEGKLSINTDFCSIVMP